MAPGSSEIHAVRQRIPHASWWCVVSTVLMTGALVFNFAVIDPTQNPIGLWSNFIDLRVYWLAGRLLDAGHSLYDGGIIGQLPFTYPPFAGILFWGLADTDFQTLCYWWEGISVLLLAVVIGMVLRERGYRVDGYTCYLAVSLAVGAVFLDPIRTTLVFGQINIVLMLLVAIGFLRKGDHWGAGIGIGLAAGIKLTPGFFVIVLAIQRRWRTLATSVLAFAGTIACGFWVLPADSHTYWLHSMLHNNRVGSYLNRADQSLQAVVYRMAVGPTPWWIAVELVGLILIVTTLWYAAYLRNNTLMMALGRLGACLLSPFSWHHHYVWIVPLLFVMVDALGNHWVAHSGWVRAWIVCGIAGVVGTTATWMAEIVPHKKGPLVGAPLVTMYSYPYLFWQGIYVFMTLAVFVGVLVYSRARYSSQQTISC